MRSTLARAEVCRLDGGGRVEWLSGVVSLGEALGELAAMVSRATPTNGDTPLVVRAEYT